MKLPDPVHPLEPVGPLPLPVITKTVPRLRGLRSPVRGILIGVGRTPDFLVFDFGGGYVLGDDWRELVRGFAGYAPESTAHFPLGSLFSFSMRPDGTALLSNMQLPLSPDQEDANRQAFTPKPAPAPVFTQPSGPVTPRQSPVEELFWKAHQAKRLPPLDGLIREMAVLGGKYRLDFALPDKQVGIEIDGYKYHGEGQNQSHDQFTKDRGRWREIERDGWRLCRFAGREVYQDADWCVNEAASYVFDLTDVKAEETEK